MRTSSIRTLAAAAVLAALSAGSPALAQSADSDTIDISAYREHMVLLHDGKGHYVITMPVSDHYDKLFYGDGKTFHAQRVFGGSLDQGSKSASATFWEPRLDHRTQVAQVEGKWHVECGDRKTGLAPVAAEEAAKLLASATFRKPPWRYQAHLLARDDRGNYYYVDRLREDHGGQGHRLWMGRKGAMKRLQMTNIVSDSVGEIYATRRGELRFIVSQGSTLWVRGKNRRELVNVPVRDNLRLAYWELGVYPSKLGTPCDDL